MSTATQPASTGERIVDGRRVPLAGTYEVDASHSSAELVARHLVVSKVRARFTKWSAQVEIADDPTASTLRVEIDAASFSSGDAQRDGHVLSADFLDVENHPTAVYQSRSVRPVDDTTWQVDGDLTIRGVTQPVALAVTYGGAVTDPFGNDKVLFAAEATIDREQFGVSFNAPLGTGGVLIGNAVQLEIELQAVRSGE